MHIYRAEDGEVFQVDKTFHDIEKSGGLESFVHEITGVDEAAVLAYLSDGRRLRDDNLRELGGVPDQSIFVFNKRYLDYELEDVLHKLRVDPPLQKEVEFDPRHLEVITATANGHHDSVLQIFNSIRVQHEALRIASTSLDLNVLSISDVFESFSSGARRELEKQRQLLNGLEADLETIGKIQIHPEFLSPAARKAFEAGEKARTLGDYVSNVKMRQVGEACAKTHRNLVEEARSCLMRSQEVLERITEISTQLQEPRTDETELLEELRRNDAALRTEVKLVSDIKNKSTVLSLGGLRQTSLLNNDLVFLPPHIGALQTDFRAKTNFAHIQRLHNMLYAYGATLVEIVRRKEFSRFFSQRAQTIAEIMAKLSASERKRRQIYRSEVHGQLPFETKGMDDSIPAMEITSTGLSDTTMTYAIERSDLAALLDELGKLEDNWVHDDIGSPMPNPLGETRAALGKLIDRMDTLETTFDKMAEKTILSASRISLIRRHPTDHTDAEFQEVVEQLHELQDVKGEQDRFFEEERQGLHAEIRRLRSDLQEVNDQASHRQDRIEQMEGELHQLRVHNENITKINHDLNRECSKLSLEVDAQRMTIDEAQTSAAEHVQTSNTLRQEIRDIIAEADADRAILKSQCDELRWRLGKAEQELEEARSHTDVFNADIAGLKEELQRGEHETMVLRNVETALQEDLRSAQSSLHSGQLQLEESQRIAKEFLRLAVRFREAQSKAVLSAQTSLSSSKSLSNLNNSPQPLNALVEFPPIDLGDVAGGLRALQEYDLVSFNECIAKTGSTIRKWQKQCKEYRDRAKGKISFRNFAKGDLALFLPTKNSISKPWAAFNVSFPHYFLQAHGHLADQLKVREWVVARITSISEKVADNRDPGSNPYGLADGTKFFMVEAEDWTQSSASGRRKVSPQQPPAADDVPKPSSNPEPSPEDINASSNPSIGKPISPPISPMAATSNRRSDVLLNPRQRTYSTPLPQTSALHAQPVSQIEKGERQASPSRPDPSPRPPSPHLLDTRPASSLAKPSRSRPTSPLAGSPMIRPSSPLAAPFQPRASSPLTGPPYVHLSSSPASADVNGPPPLSSSDPHHTLPDVGPVVDSSPSHASSNSAMLPLHSGSRRSSSSSRQSSIFSAGRHISALSRSQKAAPTTAISAGTLVGPPSSSPPSARPILVSGGSRQARETGTPSPQGSPSDGMAGILQGRRRTTSALMRGSSPLSAPTNAVPAGAISNLTNSWGAAFGRKKSSRQSAREPLNMSTRSSTTTIRTHRAGASDILKRFDDILPQDR